MTTIKGYPDFRFLEINNTSCLLFFKPNQSPRDSFFGMFQTSIEVLFGIFQNLVCIVLNLKNYNDKNL